MGNHKIQHNNQQKELKRLVLEEILITRSEIDLIFPLDDADGENGDVTDAINLRRISLCRRSSFTVSYLAAVTLDTNRVEP